MSSVGTRLRQARREREVSLEDFARTTQIGREFLEALEGDAIDALPGRAFGKLYIRTYAEKLGFDPDPLLDDYDRALSASPDESDETPVERRQPGRVAAAVAAWRAERIAAHEAAPATSDADPQHSVPEDETERADDQIERSAVGSEPPAEELALAEEPAPAEELAFETEPALAVETLAADDASAAVDATLPSDTPAAEAASTPRVPARNWTAALVAALGLLGAIAILLLGLGLFGSDGQDGAARTEPAATAVDPGVEATPSSAPLPTAASTREATAAPEMPPGRLSVSESGVGRRVVSRRLDGAASKFREGQEVVYQTRVRGGRRGDRIRHVWLLDGRAMQSIELTLGSSNWRTHSSKTLNGRGNWTVEARDVEGRVLASNAFVCEP